MLEFTNALGEAISNFILITWFPVVLSAIFWVIVLGVHSLLIDETIDARTH